MEFRLLLLYSFFLCAVIVTGTLSEEHLQITDEIEEKNVEASDSLSILNKTESSSLRQNSLNNNDVTDEFSSRVKRSVDSSPNNNVKKVAKHASSTRKRKNKENSNRKGQSHKGHKKPSKGKGKKNSKFFQTLKSEAIKAALKSLAENINQDVGRTQKIIKALKNKCLNKASDLCGASANSHIAPQTFIECFLEYYEKNCKKK